jgi:hypothetical protein
MLYARSRAKAVVAPSAPAIPPTLQLLTASSSANLWNAAIADCNFQVPKKN